MMSLRIRDIKACSTTVKKKNGDAKMKKTHNIAWGSVRVLVREKLVVCHVQPYQYTVFYYHKMGNSKAQGGVDRE